MTMHIRQGDIYHRIKLDRLISGDGFVYENRLYVVVRRPVLDGRLVRCFCFHSPIGEQDLDQNLEVSTATINIEWSTT